jgi:tetratricopeptide (TPR) repeat protein
MAEFSPEKIATLTDPASKEQAQFLVSLGNRAHEVLSDYKKREDYEKKGFREVDPSAVKEEEPEEIAKEYYKKSKALFAQKKFSMAAKGMEAAIAQDPSKAEYYLMLGKCQTQVPELKRSAEVNLQKAAEMEAWNAEPVVALGMLFYSERLNKRAEIYFKKALEIQNDHPVARKKLAEIGTPEEKPLEKIGKSLQDGLGKVFPSFFGKKKKR